MLGTPLRLCRLVAAWMSLGLSLASLAGCCCRPGCRAVTNPSPPEIIDQRDREMSVLAFVSYAGARLKGTDESVQLRLAPCLQTELDRQPVLNRDWSLAWGPGVFRFETSTVESNVMFAVESRSNPSDLVVVIRGTNGADFTTWLLEDLGIRETRPWPLNPEAGAISEGSARGLGILAEMTPATGTPGSGETLRSFLAHRTDLRRVTVVGHSLGGVLAPLYALYLEDSRADWNPDSTVELEVHSLAGPSPGNRSFAQYYASRLQASTHRHHNPLDVATLVWSPETIPAVPCLYEPLIDAPEGTPELACLAARRTRRRDYAALLPDAPPLAGAPHPAKLDYFDQVDWQHRCAYYCLMEIAGQFETVTPDCVDFEPSSECPQCPANL